MLFSFAAGELSCVSISQLKMEAQEEKVYVALGDELQDGYKTLEWTLRRWKSQPFSIVILHVTYKLSGKDYVYTPCKLQN